MSLLVAVSPPVALSAAAAFGCHSDMYDQPKYEPLEGSPFFEDGRSARPYEPNVVPRGRPVVDGPRETGREGSGFVTEIPLSVDAKQVEVWSLAPESLRLGVR